MKVADITKAVLGGDVLIVGTYFSGRVQRITVRDKSPGANGAKKDLLIAKEIVMTEREPFTVSQFLPDSSIETEKAWAPSAKKGDAVVVVLRSLKEDLGNKSGDGKITLLEK